MARKKRERSDPVSEQANLLKRYGFVRLCRRCEAEVVDRTDHWWCPRCGFLGKSLLNPQVTRLAQAGPIRAYVLAHEPEQLALDFGRDGPGLAKAPPTDPPPHSEQQAPKRRRKA
jgi:hypothetical protein